MLSGCRDDDARSDSPPPPGPTATSKAVPHAAARLAGRYRQFGGDRDVHGIQRKPGPGG